jgi:hypothetical protein
MRIILRDHKDSLESIERGGQIVKVLGKGIMKSPGHPAGNQQYHRQLPFLKFACEFPYLFPIFNIETTKKVNLLGLYRLLNYKIKLSNEGFRYYEFTMMRVNYNRQDDEPSAVPSLYH